ncbi:MAG: hypothetical protein LBT38_08780 [Deltaproteobacteria bacterium]|nr:hypothetical protein [Deltaproteobacteria bacterium]
MEMKDFLNKEISKLIDLHHRELDDAMLSDEPMAKIEQACSKTIKNLMELMINSLNIEKD